MVFEDSRVTGVIGPDPGIEVRRNLPPAIGSLLLRIEVIHRPVPAPARALWLGFKPRHVVGQNSWPLLA